MQTKWLSAYIFSTIGLNTVLNDQIIPFLQVAGAYLKTPSPYFFIRYGEGGPHIRLRMDIPEENEDIVRKMLSEHAIVQYVPYLPEIERYGGLSTIALAEQQFHLCSEYVLSLISSQKWDYSMVLIQAIQLDMTLLFALQVSPEETIKICKQFIGAWLPRLYDRQQDSRDQEKYFLSLMEKQFAVYAPSILSLTAKFWTSLHQGQATIQQYADRHIPLLRNYQQLVDDTRKMRTIMCSLLHMQHNRLGIPNTDEAYAVFFTMKCMEHIYEKVS